MNLPLFPEFKLVGLEDQASIKAQIAKYPSDACEVNFANTFIWRKFDHPKFTTIHDNLCLLFEPPDEPAYFLQLIGGERIIETIRTCLGAAPRLSRLPRAFVQKYCSGFMVKEDRDNFDYVYRTDDLIHLEGKRYDGKRNRIRKFLRNNTCQYIKLSPGRVAECLGLLEYWFNSKPSADRTLWAQREAIIEALVNYDALGLVGGAVEVEGKIAAFSLGGELTPETAVIHIEIVNPAYDGLAQFMNREFIRDEWAGYKFINREQDLGISGLRRAKMSYHPHHLVKKYDVSLPRRSTSWRSQG